MVISRDDLGDLRAAPRLATCPACTAFAKTVFVQDSLGTRSKTSLGFKTVFSLGLSLFWSRKKPRCAWFTHYCGECGLRLVLCDEAGNRNYVEPSQLVALRSSDGVARRIAPSPYPSSSLMVKDAPHVGARYRHLRPTSTFSVQFGGIPGVPAKIVRTRGIGGTYAVDCPDLDWNGKFHVDFLIQSRRNKARLVKTVWSHQRPSIRISSSPCTDSSGITGLIQLSQLRWDIKLYFPQEANDQSSIQKYESRMIGAHDEYIFNPELPHVLWKSSSGHLLWTRRLTKDGTASSNVIQRRLILVDSYDRLVAMEIDSEPRSTRDRYIKTTDPPPDPSLPRKLSIYGNLQHHVIEEIITSYVAVLAQIYRKAHKDYELLMETQQ